MDSKGESSKETTMHIIPLRGHTFLEEGRFVSRCDTLGISDHGDTREKAHENLGKTLALFFISCAKRGTLEDFLREKGLESIIISGGDKGNYVPLVLLSDFDASTSGDKRRMSG